MNLEILKSHYDLEYSINEKFILSIAEQISSLLKQNGLNLAVPLQSRVKTFSSILNKIERGGSVIPPLHHIFDLVGLRLILLFNKDLEKAKSIIEGNFAVVGVEDTALRLSQDQFGYASLHYQVKLKSEWLKLPTYSGYKELSAEIQVRTIAQHIWAAASHELQYKNEKNVPAPVRRAIHRVSALLETVDLEFDRVLSQREEYLTKVTTKNIDSILDVDLLEKYLNESLPEKNKREGEESDYSQLLFDLSHVGILNIRQLNELWTNYGELAIKADAEIAAQITQDKKDPRNSKRVESGIYLAQVGLIRKAIEFAKRTTFGKEIKITDIDPAELKRFPGLEN